MSLLRCIAYLMVFVWSYIYQVVGLKLVVIGVAPKLDGNVEQIQAVLDTWANSNNINTSLVNIVLFSCIDNVPDTHRIPICRCSDNFSIHYYILDYLATNYASSSFVMLVTMTSYVVIPNLITHLSSLTTKEYVFQGEKLIVPKGNSFLSSGAGYIISRKLLIRLAFKWDTSQNPCFPNGYMDDFGKANPDITIANCVASMKIPILDSENLFNVYNPERIAKNNIDMWYRRYHTNKAALDIKLQSRPKEVITFHFLSPAQMRRTFLLLQNDYFEPNNVKKISYPYVPEAYLWLYSIRKHIHQNTVGNKQSL